MKKNRGCKRKRKKYVAIFTCTCRNKKTCDICDGKGTFKFYMCPMSVMFEPNIFRTLSYFFHWVGTECKEYPNGQGLYYQPLKLIDAFDLLNCEYVKYKGKEL